MKIRTYGWIQNPGKFESLKKVVQIFDPHSQHYRKLRDELIDKSMYFERDKKRFKDMLISGLSSFSYIDLVGTTRNKNNRSPKTRGDAIGNSLIQVSITPQQTKKNNKTWTDNWTSDGFLRWAVSLNFVDHDRESDMFKITEKGLELSESEDSSDKENEILINAMMAYPPAYQVLSILNEKPEALHSKYAIGSKLGFQGESGFTSYNENLIFEWLHSSTKEEKTIIKRDVEGTADKYARGIANWLKNLGLVKPPKRLTKKFNDGSSEFLTAYAITAKGQHTLRKASGSSKNVRKEKFIKWEFLATNAENKYYIRTRRSYILKFLQETKSWKTLQDLLKEKGFNDSKSVIINDLKGLKMFGLNIDYDEKRINLKDNLNDFDIPDLNVTEEIKMSKVNEMKEQLMEKTDIPVKYYELVDIAFDGKRNRDFEIITMELFKDIYEVNSVLLGGGRKPDGLTFTDQYGIIVDTKAYTNGYSKSISQSDEMIRYIEDNKLRDKHRNKTEWWKHFSPEIPSNNFYFMWVSSFFVGEFEDQLTETSYATGTDGCALNVQQLILGADAVQRGDLNVANIPDYINNQEIYFVN